MELGKVKLLITSETMQSCVCVLLNDHLERRSQIDIILCVCFVDTFLMLVKVVWQLFKWDKSAIFLYHKSTVAFNYGILVVISLSLAFIHVDNIGGTCDIYLAFIPEIYK